MPAPVGRDLEATRAQLLAWLPKVLPTATGLKVGALSGPGATGFSSDTLMFDLSYEEDGRRHSESLVLRLHPDGILLFPEYDLPRQFRLMASLAGSEVPVPRMRWEEPDAAPLGANFYVMDRVEGRVPADNPPYNAEGWVAELTASDREVMWQSYLEALAGIHALDPAALDLGFLAMPELGATPLEQELAYYERYYHWAFDERKHPHVERSLAWLKANRPPGPEPVRLAWGDARIGNMIFRDNRVVAVLDWEMARLGNPVMDLAWGLFLDRYHTEGNGIERLPGFPTREGTIALYEEISGARVENVEYYELLAGMRFSVILIRLGQQLMGYEFMPVDSDFEVNNPVSNLHARQLDEMGIP